MRAPSLKKWRIGWLTVTSKIENDILKIKQKYLKGFRKALPARKAARFYQLENKMDAELKSQLALIVPLIDPV